MIDPYYDRPRIWDSVLQKFRYAYWEELDDNQRNAEMEYHNERNFKILREMQLNERITHPTT